jgi:4-hydroxy-3-polyprenylbenzoate decarboxylase
MIAFQDLQEYIAHLETQRELKRIPVAVDSVLEITEIADRMVKARGPALLFEQVKGSAFPLAINLFGTHERACCALGVQRFDEIAERIISLIPLSMPESLIDKMKFLLKLKDIGSIQPKRVSSGPVQEVLEPSPNLLALPVLHCWPKDAGRFITLPLVITKNPHTQMQNVGMYRVQIVSEKRAIMHWHLHHDGAGNFRLHRELGREMDVAIALGGDPATIYAATAPLPPGIDEMIFAGFLRNTPVEVVRGKTVDLMVPAHAEFIIEGTISITETQLEGPFGDHTGFYSGAEEYPVIHIKAITRRKSPVYPATIVGKPPMEDCYFGKATERIFLPLIKFQLPEVVDLHLPGEGVFHNCVIVSIKKEYPGHARKVASALWGMGQMMFAKFIIIVEHDVDVQNLSEVAWKAFGNTDPERDIFFTKGPLDVLDHSSPVPLYGSKIGIDATRKWKEEGHVREWPEEIKMSEEIKVLVNRRWNEYGF